MGSYSYKFKTVEQPTWNLVDVKNEVQLRARCNHRRHEHQTDNYEHSETLDSSIKS